MKVEHIIGAFILFALISGCTPDAAKGGLLVSGYNKTVRELDVTFYTADDMLSARSKVSGSIQGSSVQLARAAEEDFANFAKAVKLHLESTMAADGVPASVEIAATEAQAARSRGKAHLLAIKPIYYRTSCAPCYTVAEYRLDLIDVATQRPTWTSDIKIVPKKEQQATVQAFWDKIKESLRSDGLI